MKDSEGIRIHLKEGRDDLFEYHRDFCVEQEIADVLDNDSQCFVTFNGDHIDIYKFFADIEKEEKGKVAKILEGKTEKAIGIKVKIQGIRLTIDKKINIEKVDRYLFNKFKEDLTPGKEERLKPGLNFSVTENVISFYDRNGIDKKILVELVGICKKIGNLTNIEVSRVNNNDIIDVIILPDIMGNRKKYKLKE